MKRTRDGPSFEDDQVAKRRNITHLIETEEDSLDENDCINDELDRNERRKVLFDVWNQILNTLHKLEVHVRSGKPWDNKEYADVFTYDFIRCLLNL